MSRASWLAGLALSLAACGHLAPLPRTAYVLHLNAAHPERSQRCRVENVEDKATEVGCQVWKGDALSRGSLTVDVIERDADVKYDVHVAQTVRDADPAELRRFLDGLADRAAEALHSVAKENLDNSTTLTAVVDAASDAAPRLAAAVEARLAPEEKRPKPAPAVVFKHDVVAATATAKARLKSLAEARQGHLDATYNAGSDFQPAARLYHFSDADLAYIEKEKEIDEADLKTWVSGWCTAASFQSDADHQLRYQALAGAPDVDGFRSALDISASDLATILSRGSASGPLDEKLERWIAEADGADWSKVSGPAKTYFLMRLGTGVELQTAACAANLHKLGLSPPPDLLDLQANAHRYAQAFADALGPLVAASFQQLEHDAEANADGRFGTFDLTPGDIALELGATRQDHRQVLGTYRADVAGMERLALVIGPMVTMCRSSWACFDTFSEYSDARGRMIVRNRDSRDVALATALHVTLRAWDRSALGLVVGYPLGTPGPTKYNLLAGFGLRFRAGGELTVGVHVFRTPMLRTGYEATPIKLYENDRESLTVDAVTRERWRAGIFVMLGLDAGVFAKLAPN